MRISQVTTPYIFEDQETVPMAPENLETVRQIFSSMGINYIEPKKTTVKQIANKTEGNHKGIYFIYCPDATSGKLVYFYIGKAIGKKSEHHIADRFQTHYLKLKADLKSLYGPEGEKVQPGMEFPKNWRVAVAQQIFGIDVPIPEHYEVVQGYVDPVTGKPKKRVKPMNLDWQAPEMKQNPDNFPVLIWDLSKLSSEAITYIESNMIQAYKPICNNDADKHSTRQYAVPENIMAQPAFQAATKTVRATPAKVTRVAPPSPKPDSNAAGREMLAQVYSNPEIKQTMEKLYGTEKSKAQQYVLAQVRVALSQNTSINIPAISQELARIEASA